MPEDAQDPAYSTGAPVGCSEVTLAHRQVIGLIRLTTAIRASDSPPVNVKMALERGMGLSMHCRWYESYAGRLVYGAMCGLEWASRERPIV